MVGSKVNLAARLMTVGASPNEDYGGILCDLETYNEVNSFYKFKEHQSVMLKWIKDTVRIFSPIGKIHQENREVEKKFKV